MDSLSFVSQLEQPRGARLTDIGQLGLKYVDLYLVHSPSLAKGDIPGLWEKMEKIKADGYAR